MANNANVKVKVEGEKEFKQAMQNMTQASKTLAAQMKAVTSSFDENTSAQTQATEKSKVLTQQIEKEKEKLAAYKDQIEKVSAAKGEDSSETQKLKQKYYETEATLNKFNKELDECQTELKQTSTNTQTSVKKFDLLKTSIKNIDLDEVSSKLNTLSNTLAKGLVAGASAAATAIVSLGKKSIELYSETEQLKGGIEKLFGSDFQAVLANANNAYKTVGISANEYMESVTTFSASLISSLGGDTQKAATIADQAMTQIADNANTFGTDIEDIINVYKNFAKENYTTLDNLNLGFAGTKEGMQDLLDKAEELSGKEFDISNFSDVIEAIGLVQDAMGIAGTTAEEASSTIQGSLDSVSAAWDNLLAGLADPDADIGLLVDNMMDAAGTAMNNLVPVIKRVAENIPKALKRAFPEAESTIDAFAKGISSLIAIVEKLMPVINSLASNMGSLFTGGVVAAGITKLGSAIASTTPQILAYTDSLKAHIAWNSKWKTIAQETGYYKTMREEMQKIEKTGVSFVNTSEAYSSEIKSQTTKAGDSITTLVSKYNASGKEFSIISKELKKSSGEVVTSLQGINDAGERFSIKDVIKQSDLVREEYDKHQVAATEFKENFKTNLSSILGGITSIIGIATTVVGIISTVYQLWKEYHEAMIEELAALTDEEEALKTSVENTASSLESQASALQSSLTSIDSEYDHVQALANELVSLADENGNVKDTDKARADFILGELNEALGTEYKMTGLQIDNYKELKSSITSLIETKRAEASLSAMESDYTEAVKAQKIAYDEAQEAFLNYAAFMESEQYNYIEKQQEWQDKLAEIQENGNAQEYNLTNQAYLSWYKQNSIKIEAANQKNDELKATYDTAEDNLESYYNTINTYESAAAAATQENWDDVIDIVNNGITDRTAQYDSQIALAKKYTDDELAVYQEQLANLQLQYTQLMADKEAYGDDWSEEQQAQLDDAKQKLEDFINPSYQEAIVAKANLTGESIGSAVVGATEDAINNGSIEAEANQLVDDAKNSAKAEASSFSQVGEAALDGTKAGITNTTKQNSVFSSISTFCSNLLARAKKALQIASPSKVFKNIIGKNIVLGIGSGITETMPSIEKLAEKEIGSLANISSKSIPLKINSEISSKVSSDALNYNINLSNQTSLESAMRNALQGVSVTMDGERMGKFVENTTAKAVYG